jgi:secreted Zn-dependent insulinase-like peptidase
MKKDAVTREINAIESEFRGEYTDDEARAEQLISSFAGKKAGNGASGKPHTLDRFGWGSLKSLARVSKEGEPYDEDALLEDVWRFYQTEYSANRMNLVVQAQPKSKEEFDDIKNWIIEYFSVIENKSLKTP